MMLNSYKTKLSILAPSSISLKKLTCLGSSVVAGTSSESEVFDVLQDSCDEPALCLSNAVLAS